MRVPPTAYICLWGQSCNRPGELSQFPRAVRSHVDPHPIKSHCYDVEKNRYVVRISAGSWVNFYFSSSSTFLGENYAIVAGVRLKGHERRLARERFNYRHYFSHKPRTHSDISTLRDKIKIHSRDLLALSFRDRRLSRQLRFIFRAYVNAPVCLHAISV